MNKKKRVFFALLGLSVISFAIISIVSLRWVRVHEHMVYFDALPSHLEGLRILHISDLHSNHVSRMNVDIWRHIELLEFDIAVITGDIVTDQSWPLAGPMPYLDPHKPYLATLAARVPTFFVEGNHESRSYGLFKPIMEDLGITFLRNEIYQLPLNGGYLEIVGTKDLSSIRRMRAGEGDAALAALFDAPADFRLVLTHQPQVFDLVKDHGQMLLLAGHTHGGQLRLPFAPVLYAPGQGFFPIYGEGYYRHESEHGHEALLYVSSGVGTTYFPLRFWIRPVITVHELSSRT